MIALFFFFFNDTATTEIYTLSPTRRSSDLLRRIRWDYEDESPLPTANRLEPPRECLSRSEEHTSELQSHVNLVCRLLLEKKKQQSQPPLHLNKKKKNKNKK